MAAIEFRELQSQGILTVGRRTYGRPRVVNYAGSERHVRIGAFCSISPGVEIVTGGVHPMDWVSLYLLRIHYGLGGAYQDRMPTSRGDVGIGSDV